MEIKHIGTRGIVVNYNDLVDTDFSCTTNIYIINDLQTKVIIDTFLGPDIMAETFKALTLDPAQINKVINTHSDWDHIWGNSYFPNAQIIAHQGFAEHVDYPESAEFVEIRKYAKGPIHIVEPSITFDSKLKLPRIGLEIFYTPGHSADSISVYDEKDHILIVGDNCEAPIPSYVDAFLLEEHLKSLIKYLEFDFEYIIPGHGAVMTRKDLLVNIQYLEDLISGEQAQLDKYLEGDFKMNHLTNLMYMGENKTPNHEKE